MRAARAVAGTLGVAGIFWGGWLLTDDGPERLQSTALWFVGVVVLHDLVLAPLVVVLGVAAARTFPRRGRAVGAIAFLIWATVTLAVANVLSGVGGRPGMGSLLDRPYASAWLILTGLVVVGAVVTAAFKARLRRARAPHP